VSKPRYADSDALPQEIDVSAEYGNFRGHRDQLFGGLTFAQAGEDLIIANLFHRMGINRPTYLDIGAHHPIQISNTAFFYLRGSSGVNVEANPYLIPEFQRLRPRDVTINIGVADVAGEMDFYIFDDHSGRNTFDQAVAEAFVQEHPQFPILRRVSVEVTTINALVDQYCSGVFPDLLTIDAEGFDARILRSIVFGRSRPSVICAEIPARDPVNAFLQDNAYSIAFRTRSNTIFTAA
jgi:FkbM family methyltransferase